MKTIKIEMTRTDKIKVELDPEYFNEDWFEFEGTENDAYRQIGNAVPVDMGRWIGQQLLKYFS